MCQHMSQLKPHCGECLKSENISSESLKSKTSPKKVLSWGKIDQEKYRKELKNSLSIHTSICDVESEVPGSFATFLYATYTCKSAAKKAVPSKTLKLKGPKKRASQKLLECSRHITSGGCSWKTEYWPAV